MFSSHSDWLKIVQLGIIIIRNYIPLLLSVFELQRKASAILSLSSEGHSATSQVHNAHDIQLFNRFHYLHFYTRQIMSWNAF